MERPRYWFDNLADRFAERLSKRLIPPPRQPSRRLHLTLRWSIVLAILSVQGALSGLLLYWILIGLFPSFAADVLHLR